MLCGEDVQQWQCQQDLLPCVVVVVTLSDKSLFARAWRMHRRQHLCLGVQRQHVQACVPFEVFVQLWP